MIEDTQKKLREAQFFLAHLEGEVTKPGTHRTEPAAFYFSAFLSAARSVTFVLEAEAHNEYKSWFPSWFASRSKREAFLLNRFVFARNRALKRQTPSVAEDRAASAQFSGKLPPELIFFTEEEEPIPGRRVLKCRLRPKDAEEEVVPLCREYATLLSDLVRAFIEAEHHGNDTGVLAYLIRKCLEVWRTVIKSRGG